MKPTRVKKALPAPHVSIERLAAHEPLWEKCKSFLLSKQLPSALLLVGPRHLAITTFANRLMATFLCKDKDAPCGVCRECRFLMQASHPDITSIIEDEGAIKIEQVRELQQNVYLAPQRGSRRFVVMAPVDKMNTFASNALLKVLEEPPAHTHFILIAEQLGTIPATIVSRCQKYSFPGASTKEGYSLLGAFYPDTSERSILFKQRFAVVDALCDVIETKKTPCTVAEEWSVFGLENLVWLLYLITAEAIHGQLFGASAEVSPFLRLSNASNAVALFAQLELLNVIKKKIVKQLPMNQTLVLEDVLLGYLQGT